MWESAIRAARYGFTINHSLFSLLYSQPAFVSVIGHSSCDDIRQAKEGYLRTPSAHRTLGTNCTPPFQTVLGSGYRNNIYIDAK